MKIYRHQFGWRKSYASMVELHPHGDYLGIDQSSILSDSVPFKSFGATLLFDLLSYFAFFYFPIYLEGLHFLFSVHINIRVLSYDCELPCELKDSNVHAIMESDRLNLPDTSVVTIDLLGHQLKFSQDPNSKHLGTTVWDASMVFAKYLEKNSRKGRFCPSKLKGKRVIELGAGCGVAGFGMAMLGCEVITSDQKEVVPLLQRNVDRNTSMIMQANDHLDFFGSIKVAELDWGNKDHIQAVDPPFDYVIGTDVVYAEHLLDPLLETIFALSGPRTTIVLGYEIRSTSVHDKMLHMWKSNFDVKTVPRTKMDPKYQHESIQLFIMGAKSSGAALGADQGNDKASEPMEKESEVKDGENSQIDEAGFQKDCSPTTSLPSRQLTDWEVRRCGTMAARLLRDVKIN